MTEEMHIKMFRFVKSIGMRGFSSLTRELTISSLLNFVKKKI